MNLDKTIRRKIIESISNVVNENADHLTKLDQAIGDGDHGINMKRGFDAVLDEIDSIAEKPLPESLKALGMKLVMTVGGASGPLYGTLFMSMGKNLTGKKPTKEEFDEAFSNTVDAIKSRGKSDEGQKTMLDVLIPIAKALAKDDDNLLAQLPEIADQAADATIPMQASKGRASFLGERSIGHMDPGARSSALITRAICETLAK